MKARPLAGKQRRLNVVIRVGFDEMSFLDQKAEEMATTRSQFAGFLFRIGLKRWQEEHDHTLSRRK